MKLYYNHFGNALEPFHLPKSFHCASRSVTIDMIEAELVSLQLLPLCLLGASMKLRKQILAWLL